MSLSTTIKRRRIKCHSESQALPLRDVLHINVVNMSLFSSYVMRRRRLQYLRDTTIRRRQYLRRRRSFISASVTTILNLNHMTKALVDNLYHRFISLPQGQRLDETIVGFVESGYPQCAGAIDGTHIPIIAPHDNHADYYNRKGWHSIVLQAVVDHKYCFTDVFIGWPGRSHDARVLANSDLYRVAEDKQGGYLFPREKSKFVDGVEIPVHIIGDAAYPLRRWLMKGFTQHVQLSPNQITYTHTLSSARMVVENAFGRLKGRWRCLMKRNDVDINIMPNIVAACCILHNLCEFQREEFLPEWTVQATAAYPALDCEAYLGDHSGSAEQMRSAIMANLPSLLR
ncbi:uncharacterized protein LOC134969901 [Pseudophryne corroboree]|uniref:uncharacterized protein LOC134969901 n=1 Tax=Pseudophryne corroboree TaxID=495146 RepID=UPI0030812B90